VLSGTPTKANPFTFTVQAANGVPPNAVTPSITITVSSPTNAPVFTADTPPTTATVGTPYSYPFAASGNPAATFSVASGSLPTGLILNGTTGVLSGTPTKANPFTFTVQAANGVPPNAVTPSITITVSSHTTCSPKITDVSPQRGRSGGKKKVDIHGSCFAGAYEVQFGKNSAIFTVGNNPGILVAVTPPHKVGTVNIRVTTPAGTSRIVKADMYTYK